MGKGHDMHAGRSLGKATIVLLLALGVLASLLCGCDRQRYKDEDAQATLERGTELSREWVANNMPDAEVATCNNWIYSYPSGPSYLTDYVRGTLALADGTQQDFCLNVVSGEVYLAPPEGMLDDAVRSYLANAFGIADEDDFSQVHASLLVPYRVDGSTIDRAASVDVLELKMVPSDVTDLDAFVRDAAQRYRITVHATAYVDDELQLSRWDLSNLLDICEQANLRFFSLYLSNRHEVVECLDDESYYEHWDWYDVGPFRLWAQDLHVSEELGKKGGIVSEAKPANPPKDLTIGELDDGYSLTYAGTRFSYVPYVREGSALLEHEWTMHDEDGDVDVHWVFAGDGLWVLESLGGNRCYVYQDSTLTRR